MALSLVDAGRVSPNIDRLTRATWDSLEGMPIIAVCINMTTALPSNWHAKPNQNYQISRNSLAHKNTTLLGGMVWLMVWLLNLDPQIPMS